MLSKSDMAEAASVQLLTQQKPEPTRFIDEKTLRAQLPVCRRTFQNWRDQGIIPFIKIGRRILYYWPDVEAALRRHTKGGPCE